MDLLTYFGTLFSCQGARNIRAQRPGPLIVPEYIASVGRGPAPKPGSGNCNRIGSEVKPRRISPVHWVDALAGALMATRRSSVFSEGWGELPDASAEVTPVDVDWRPAGYRGAAQVSEGTFQSPAPLPDDASQGRVRRYRPARIRGTCVHLAASNEEGYRRREFLALELAEHGIESLLLENPFYGARRIRNGAPVRTVGELLTMGAAAVQEAHGLLLGFEGPVGVSGYSMGGNIAALVAATHPRPLAAIPLAPSPSPAVVFSEGLLSRFVDWGRLGCSRSELADVLDRASVIELPPPLRSDWAIIVAARGDAYIPQHAVEALHQHWPGSELRWAPGGHLSLATTGRRRLVEAILDAFSRAV